MSEGLAGLRVSFRGFRVFSQKDEKREIQRNVGAKQHRPFSGEEVQI